jgi:hypothetical protein
VLVVVDEPLVEEGSQLVAAAADAGARPRLELWRGAAPVEAGEKADLSYFLHHTPKAAEAGERFRLLQAVTGHGGRQLFLGFVDGDLLAGELSAPQPDLEPAARALLAQLRGARELHLGGAAGTDLVLRVEGRPWHTDALDLEPGTMANFPGGEVFSAPQADGADGVLVADAGTRADVLPHVGIGIKPTIEPRGHVMLDEKAAGTAHVADGRNTGPYGGDNESSIHVDCVFSAPVVLADGKAIALP